MADILVTQRIPGRCFEMLRDEGHALRVNTEARILSTMEIVEQIGNAEVLLCTLANEVTNEVFDVAPRLRMVANYAAGYNNIDLASATERGIVVSNTPGALTEATADLTWALLLACARRVVEGDVMCRGGRFHGWMPDLLLGREVHGTTLGIVGAGRIGSAVARRGRAFGMRVLYHSRSRNRQFEKDFEAEFLSLPELFAHSDYISVHLPATPQTIGLIDYALLSKAKKGAILINTGRGTVVVEADLVKALVSGKLAGAALDVYEREPQIHRDLLTMPNVVLAPHTGSATDVTRSRMGELAAANIIAFLRGDTPPNALNPEILPNA